MPRKKTTTIDEILAIPHTKLIDGQPYVRIAYRDTAGKWRDKARRVNSVAEAISAIEKIRQEIGDRGPGAYYGEKMTFAELLEECRKAKPIPKWYADPLIEHFGQKRIKTITYGDIEQFKAARSAVKKEFRDPDDPEKMIQLDRKPATVNRELEWLRRILLYAVRHDWLLKNPFQRGPAPLIRKSEEKRRDRVPTPDEEARILAVCVGLREHLRSILIAARDTGLRRGALL
jgi:hypothetical protein